VNAQPDISYSLILFPASGISFFIAYLAWIRRRTAPCARYLAANSLANGVWSLFYAFHWTTLYRFSEFFWVDMCYLGIVFAPSTLLSFIFCYTNRNTPIVKKIIRQTYLVPVIILFLLWTDPWLGLFYGGNPRGGSAAVVGRGIGFWLAIGWSYVLMTIAIVDILHAYVTYPKHYRGQTTLILLGTTFPVILNIISIAGWLDLPDFDITPTALSVTGVAFALAILSQGLLDLMPVDRGFVFETHRDYIAILNTQKRVVDVNRNFHKLFPHNTSDCIGAYFYELRSAYPELPQPKFFSKEEHYEFSLTHLPEKYLEMIIYPIKQTPDEITGYVLTIRDVTVQNKANQALLIAYEKLEKQLAENKNLQEKLREESIRDPLTNLYNRRYFYEALSRELQRAERDGQTVGIIMLDIDHFKRINDTYGHDAGDTVLRAVGAFLQHNTRGADIACRYGGEELTLVLPGASLADTQQRAEVLRAGIQALVVQHNGQALAQVTISLGVAVFPEHSVLADDIIRAADQALYQAKRNGRNRVEVGTSRHSEA
jgi:diguanylate cyclase (GGDEF)-like protein